jgi:hypothetical protein
LNEEILAGIPDIDLEQAILDYVWLRIGDDWDHEPEILAGLAPGIRAVYASHRLDAEVGNGGLSQFFSNSSGRLAYQALAGLRLIGADEHARILEKAVALEKERGTPYSRFPDTGAPEEVDEDHDYADYAELDDQFFATGQDLSQLRIGFIRAHPELLVGERVA